MRMSRVLMIGMVLALGACSNEKGIRVLSSSGDGPDEFRIVPGKPLTQPTDYAALPPPTPGQGNLTDQNPVADATVALGGSAKARTSTAVSGSDGAMINYASRKGRSGDIRQSLAAEDAEFRRKRGRFTNIRIVRTDRYNEVYKKDQLDMHPEWWRWRQAGAKTPSAPPGG